MAETATGLVRLNPRQRYRGASFFVAKACVREVHHLDPTTRRAHLEELAEAAAAADETFRPLKLNLESLGNSVPHLHWWITPRDADDPRPRGPIWESLDFLEELWVDGGRADRATLEAAAAAARLGAALARRGVAV